MPFIDLVAPKTPPTIEAQAQPADPILPQPAADGFVRPQFCIRDLMIATALVAIYLGVARLIGIVALVLAFVGYFIMTCATLRSKRTPLLQLSLDLMAGVLLPIGCIVYDPFVFHAPTLRVVGLATIGSQVVVLCLWMFVAPFAGRWAFGVASGFLLFGALAAGLIGVGLLPFSAIGLLVMIGALGFVPFFTAATYFRHARKAMRHAPAGNNGQGLIWSGILLALAVPLSAALLADYVPSQWLRPPQNGFFDAFNNVPNNW